MNKKGGVNMEISQGNVPTWDRWNAYQREKEAIKRKLENGVPEGKKGRLKYRLNDLEIRLIPIVIKELQSS